MNNTTRLQPSFPPYAQTVVGIVFGILLLLTIVLNVMALRVLYRTRARYSVLFSVYLAHVFLSNILVNLLDIPFDFFDKMFPGHLTFTPCIVYSYVNWMLFAILTNAHLLITLNRVWAVVHPFSYHRLQHSLRLAVGSCAVTWLFVHVCAGPLFIYRIYRLNEHDTCLIDMTDYSPAQSIPVQIWETAVFAVLFVVPIVSIVALYPWIAWKRKQAKRFLRRDSTKVARQSVTDGKTFRVLMVLTGSLLFSWIPELIWWIMQDWVGIDAAVYAVIDLVLDMTWAAQGLLDPTLFIMVLRE
ncbi:type-1 angiotensin II receptor B-like [Paramacrobiotus metropolitanus]|uniref:type-1 angiotensin II receptor B-like n=1 Tax=Paramacrobiotus metropolitanus TaxID=2943436 RepID=UPI002445E50B|nr:type-1 angiotensin II receptor B-like [Paramacrobiotus metropolitanus]